MVSRSLDFRRQIMIDQACARLCNVKVALHKNPTDIYE